MSKEVKKTVKSRGSRRVVRKGLRGKPGGSISLESTKDRAWLGALIVGEGSIFNKPSKTRSPCLAIKMLDKPAIDKVAKLMGVRTVAAGWSEITRRRAWHATITGGRAMRVIDLVRPFLTSVKVKQSDAAIAVARAAGFKTRQEMREKRKLKVLETVRLIPGSFTRRIRYANNLRLETVKKYLAELEKDGSVREESDGTATRRVCWFPTQDNQVAPAGSAHPSSSVSSDTLAQDISSPIQNANSHLPQDANGGGSGLGHAPEIMLTDCRGRVVRKGFRGKRGGELRLANAEDRAWLGALIVGEGTIYTRGPRAKIVREPRLAIRMLDKEAIDKAGALMGTRTCAGGRSRPTGRKFWVVQAVGGRAIEVLELLRPFMTPAKLGQADAAIRHSRKTGFRTNREKRENRKDMIEECVRRWPGASTREIGKRTGVGHPRTRIYLQELVEEGKVKLENSGSVGRRRTNWFAGGS